MESVRLSGLERLLDVCRRLGLRADVTPPRRTQPVVGSAICGHPLDPVLAAVYAQFGYVYVAEDVYVLRVDERENQLETQNRWWNERWQPQLAMPLSLFGGKASLAYFLATVPGLADESGWQPVVQVDTNELDGPYALPLASNVDRYFDVYSRYLEALVTHPSFTADGMTALTFPWEVPELFARDERLVELIRAGSFAPLMPGPEERAWAARVVALADARH